MAALIELKLICSRIFTDKAFSMVTAKKFRNIGICAFAELLIFSVDQAVLCSMLAVYELMGLYYLPVFVFAFVCVVRESSRSRWAACSSARRLLKKKTTRYFDGGVTA